MFIHKNTEFEKTKFTHTTTSTLIDTHTRVPVFTQLNTHTQNQHHTHVRKTFENAKNIVVRYKCMVNVQSKIQNDSPKCIFV